MFYTVTAYRWGSTNDHNYLVTVTDDEAQAVKTAESVYDGRGGSYGIQVLERSEVGLRQVAYFPSMAKEPQPEHNFYLDMLQAIGAHVHETVMSGGVVWDAPANVSGNGPNVPRSVDVPEWVLQTVRSEAVQCRMSDIFQEQNRNKPAMTIAAWRACKKDFAAIDKALDIAEKVEQEIDASLAGALERKAQLLKGAAS